MDDTFTKEQIKRVFIETFHRSGEWWFDYFDSEEETMKSILIDWKEFYGDLVAARQSDERRK